MLDGAFGACLELFSFYFFEGKRGWLRCVRTVGFGVFTFNFPLCSITFRYFFSGKTFSGSTRIANSAASVACLVLSLYSTSVSGLFFLYLHVLCVNIIHRWIFFLHHTVSCVCVGICVSDSVGVPLYYITHKKLVLLTNCKPEFFFCPLSSIDYQKKMLRFFSF